MTIFFNFSVNCLSCYRCTSEVSWEDCNSNLTKTTCSPGSPNCLKGELTCSNGKARKTVFHKRCGAHGQTCDTTKEDDPPCPFSPRGWFGFEHENTCCYGNNCNAGSKLKISSVMNGVYLLIVLCAFTNLY